VIKSFRGKTAEQIHYGRRAPRFPAELYRIAQRKLAMIDAATSLEDLRVPPSNHLESLRGDRKGEHSIRINDQWRICFIWKDGNAYGVEVTDYH
jgi:proteic killer suppression protein